MIDIANWRSQLHKGYIELCVLKLLENKESYGGNILKSLQDTGMGIQEGTLYPLLNRMQRNGWLSSQWQTPKQSGHPRKFYSATEESRSLLPEMQKNFQELNNIYTRIENHG